MDTYFKNLIDEFLKIVSLRDLDDIVLTLTMLVPIGRVVSYSAIAKILNIHPRRVALALARNRAPIVIPCHRVIMKNGSIGGYSFSGGTEFKKKLLKIEGIPINYSRIPKKYFYDNEFLAIFK